MALFMPSAMRYYKILAIVGTLLVVLVLALSWIRVQKFEHTVLDVFEKMAVDNLEAESLKEDLQHIDKVLQQVDQQKGGNIEVTVDGIQYTSYEVERLRAEKNNILLYMREKDLDIATSSGARDHVMTEIRILFMLSLVLLMLGTLMATIGYIGWYFRLELFEDRRKRARGDE
jgi:uncharacterized protein YacL (UPF0231 family)